ncbi:MAG: MlaD family protein [Gemmatimonadota bacterium]|nr:MlaD family protein [Gemmatimonadota bacterium]
MATDDNQGLTDEQIFNAVPKQAGARNMRIGVFVLIGLVASVYLLYLLTDPATFRGRYKVTTSVENVMGLRKGDPVQMRGVNVGRVHDFDLDRDSENVVIVLEVEGEWRIPAGSTTQLVTPGIMAPRTVEILPGPGPGEIPAGGSLPGSVVKGLLDDTESLGAKGQQALDRITALLSDSTVGALETSALELRALLTELADLMGSESADLENLIESLNEAAVGIADVAGSGPALTEDITRTVSRADSLMRRLNTTTDRFDRAATSLGTILDRIERGEGTLGQLSANDTLFVSLTAAIASARLLMDDFMENPGRYINVSIF